MANIYDKLAYIGYVLIILFYSNQIYELYNINPIRYSLIFGALFYIIAMIFSIYDKYNIIENFKPISKTTQKTTKTTKAKSKTAKPISKTANLILNTTQPTQQIQQQSTQTNITLDQTKSINTQQPPNICPKQESCPPQIQCPTNGTCPTCTECPKQEPCKECQKQDRIATQLFDQQQAHGASGC